MDRLNLIISHYAACRLSISIISDVIPCPPSLSCFTPVPTEAKIALHHHKTRDRVIVHIPRDDKLVSTPVLGSLQPAVIYLINSTSLAKVNALAQLKENDTVQLHFNYSYKLRIIFHTLRFAYRKMKDAK